MQTRKRRLRSKIDREIGTELLDAKIKYSQNKILSRGKYPKIGVLVG